VTDHVTDPAHDRPTADDLHATTLDSNLHAPVDLDAIEADLDAVEAALARLADGTYRVDEVTGAELPEALLVRDPTARRA
jgi:RNA polymerase-binding transcription factor DksA